MEATVGTTASLAELKAKLPDSTAEFREECLEKGLTLSAAVDAWMDRLRAAVVQERAANNRRQAGGTSTIGNRPVPSGGAPNAGGLGGSARAEWDDAVKVHTDKGLTPEEAVRRVNAEQPGLRERMLAEHNAKHGRAFREPAVM